MKQSVEFYRKRIRDTLRAVVGRDGEISLQEAAAQAGVSASALYQIASLSPHEENYRNRERYLYYLLKIEPFARRYLLDDGYSVERLDDDLEGCPYEASRSVFDTIPTLGEALHDGRITHRERLRIRDRLRLMIRPVAAFLRRESNAGVSA